MAVFGVTYTCQILSKLKDKRCHKCGIELKEGDEGMRVNGAHGKHWHKKCYERLYH